MEREQRFGDLTKDLTVRKDYLVSRQVPARRDPTKIRLILELANGPSTLEGLPERLRWSRLVRNKGY
jgi:hypothetical protein